MSEAGAARICAVSQPESDPILTIACVVAQRPKHEEDDREKYVRAKIH